MAPPPRSFTPASIKAALDRSLARVEFTPDGTITDANDVFLALLGYSLAEVRGRHHEMFVDDATRTSQAYRDFWARLRGGEFMNGEFCRVAKDGQRVWVRGTYSPVIGARGVVKGVVKYAVDVSADRLVRDADLAMQQRFWQMVENTSVRLMLADLTGTMLRR